MKQDGGEEGDLLFKINNNEIVLRRVYELMHQSQPQFNRM